jgi:hypothetical protein
MRVLQTSERVILSDLSATCIVKKKEIATLNKTPYIAIKCEVW